MSELERRCGICRRDRAILVESGTLVCVVCDMSTPAGGPPVLLRAIEREEQEQREQEQP